MPLPEAELTTVVGDPLQLPKVESPTEKDVNHWHQKYIQALQSLFDSHAPKYAKDPKSKLEVY